MTTIEDLRPDDSARIAEILARHRSHAADNPRPVHGVVTADECDRMHEMAANGRTRNEIEAEVGWTKPTISNHLNGRCSHG